MIDASAVARVVGIDVQYKDLRGGGALFLPQRIALFAQGKTGTSYSLTKWQATSAGLGGSRYGFGCPIHSMLRQLFPADGDGVGSIPVTVYPLEDAPGSVAASGNIAVSGTATAAASYRVRVSGVLSTPFVIPAGVVAGNTINGLIGDAINAVLEMPVEATWTYGTVTSLANGTNVGNGTVTALSATGSPLPGAYVLKANTAVANGGVFTLTDPRGTVIAANITMTPGVGGITVINVGGLQFTLTDGTNNFAVDDYFTITVPATDTKLTAKWKGTTGNKIFAEIIGDESLGVTFVITQPTGGLVDPDVASAIAQVGTVWETFVLNALAFDDETTLDLFQVFGESRWGELVRKPLMVFSGCTEETVEDASAVSSTRTLDRVNGQLNAPGCVNLPFVVAAREVARMARMAQNNPPTDYGGQRATGLVPGADGVQWDWVMRDQAVKAGCSTSEIRNGIVTIGDVVTFYRPVGEEPPAYACAVDIVKLQQVIFNLDLIFASDEWNGAPLIPDNQATVNPRARRPAMAVAEIGALLDSLEANAIIVDAKTAKSRTTAVINSQNPKRLDVVTTIQLAGNTNIIPVTLQFGFYFGVAAAA